MKNVLALLILIIYGGLCCLGGQYIQEHAKPVEQCNVISLGKLPTKANRVELAKLEAAIPLSVLMKGR